MKTSKMKTFLVTKTTGKVWKQYLVMAKSYSAAVAKVNGKAVRS